MVWIMILLIFFSESLKFRGRTKYQPGIPVLIGIAAVLFILAGLFVRQTRGRLTEKQVTRYVRISAVGLWLFQVFISLNIFFVAGFDSGVYVIPAARSIQRGEALTEGLLQLFSQYPNNRMLSVLYAYILKVNQMTGIFKGDYQLMSIVAVNCALNACACYLVYRLCKNCTHNLRMALAAYAAAWALVGCSPWNVVCYSDAFAAFLPITIVSLYSEKRINPIGRYTLIIVLGYLGFQIKPQILIAAIAAVLTGFIRNIFHLNRKTMLQALAIGILSLALLYGIKTGCDHLYEQKGFHLDAERAFEYPHFIMMGMNPKSLGTYYTKDVVYSASFTTRSERNAANRQVIEKRLKKYGVSGYLKLLSQKMLSNYHTGTFAYGYEGNFYMKIPANVLGDFSGKLKSLLYLDGKHYQSFALVEEIIWLCVLWGMLIQSNVCSLAAE